MSQHYFHLTIGGEHYVDTIGRVCEDLAAAHRHAVLFVGRVMAFCTLERLSPPGERCVVTIADAAGNVSMSVILRCDCVLSDIRNSPQPRPLSEDRGILALRKRLGMSAHVS